MADIYCPFCGRKLTVGHFCMGCGRDLSEYITEERETPAPVGNSTPLPDLGGLTKLAEEEARKKKIEEDFEIEGGVLKHYRGGSETVEVPSWVTVIGEEAFRGTYAEKVVLPEGITAIEKLAFCRSHIRQINLPQGLRRIGDGAFVRSDIEELHIPRSVTQIGKNAFDECKKLKLHVHLREYCEADIQRELFPR